MCFHRHKEQYIHDILGVMNDNVDVLVINDGSKDKTEEIAKASGAIVVSHQNNMGLAKTFKTGIREALRLNADVIVNIDALDAVKGKEVIIKDQSGLASITNTITVVPLGGKTIDGEASLEIDIAYGVLRIYSDGTNYFTL